jgi:hypothetical protein
MFRSRKKSRRRDRSKLTHSRRLGVELMEGRMMLSATGLDVAQPVLDLTQYSFWTSRTSLANAHTLLATQPTDGGYININSDAVAVEDYSIGHRTSVAGIISQDFRLAGGATGAFVVGYNDLFDVVPTFLKFNSFGSLDQPIGNIAHDGLNVTLLDSSGIQGALFVPWTNSDSPVANMQPVVVGARPTKHGV